MRAIAASMADIYFSIDPIGEKLHRKNQEGFPLRSIADSLADIYYFIDTIGDKLHSEKFRRDTLWNACMPQWLILIPQLTLLVKNFTEKTIGAYLPHWPTFINSLTLLVIKSTVKISRYMPYNSRICLMGRNLFLNWIHWWETSQEKISRGIPFQVCSWLIEWH